MTTPTHYFILPGLGNSGPQHWQTWMEKQSNSFQRIEQREWDAPDCNDWVETVESVLASYDLGRVVLIGHSLGCITIAHWAKRYRQKIKGALLVAPSDIETPAYAFPASGFTPIPLEPLGFPSIVVTSNNDEWVSPERAAFFANRWGSAYISIGNAGHINAASGYGEWQEGLELLRHIG